MKRNTLTAWLLGIILIFSATSCFNGPIVKGSKNYITKKEAQELGWPGGSLEPYAPGMCIGGSRFGNYEGLLPEAKGRTYTECDIDTLGAKSRGAKRIVFSNDGLVYYTGDHYESFELLYGDEGDG